ncbi:MAG: hypothetical protein JJLCMIEE_00964 [Acidimicrobiales bacterium]|nr:MAG: hypothetical protein EDR02_07255 [Actinomycetota bacterium]MBV6507906.1 hypothetical protein [Acidimicrobiales bacterium]RIK06886.1 MAG: hypothetical protein DCC48_05195 [Acidobacteriota bacterium]
MPIVALALLALLAGAMGLLVKGQLFPLYSTNHDEPMYVYEADLLADGRLTGSSEHADFVAPWASGVVDGKLVMKYTPPWPAVLMAADLLTGSKSAALAITAAAMVFMMGLVGRELFGRWSVGLAAAALTAASPVVIVLSGTFLPYLFQLFLLLVFMWGLVSGRRTHGGWRLLLAGLAIGTAFFARPYDALVVALPFGIAVLVADRRHLGRLRWTLTWLAGGAVPVVILSLVYNLVVMGSPLVLPFTVTGGSDALGFGERGVSDGLTFDFSLRDGLVAAARSAWSTMLWVAGSFLTVALAAYGFVRSKALGALRWATVGLVASVTIGYVFFWSPYSILFNWPGEKLLGPYYHLPLLVPVVLFAGRALADLLSRPRVFAVAVTLIGLSSALLLVPPINENREVTEQYRERQGFVESLGIEEGVLFFPDRGNGGFESAMPFLENDHDLSNPVIYAADRGGENLEFLDTRPGVPAFTIYEEYSPGDDLFDLPLVVKELEVRSAPEPEIVLEMENPGDTPYVIGYTSVNHGADTEEAVEVEAAQTVLDDHSSAGDTTEATVRLVAGDDPAVLGPESWTVPLGTPGSTGQLTLGVAYSHEPGLQGASRFELRFPYRVGNHEIELLTPPAEWQLWVLGEQVFWLLADVEDVLRVSPPSPP